MTKNKAALKSLAGLAALVAVSVWIIIFANGNHSLMAGLFATALLWTAVVAIASEHVQAKSQ